MNYLASPPLVVAYALAGTMDIDLDHRAARHRTATASRVFLRDIWPTPAGGRGRPSRVPSTPDMFRQSYADVFDGDEQLAARCDVPSGDRFAWDADSTYVRQPAVLRGHAAPSPRRSTDIAGARVLALLGDWSPPTTSRPPARSSRTARPAQYLDRARRASRSDFNSYGARRGNHEVMVRGTFANIRLRNQLAPGTEGGVHARTCPSGDADVDLRRRDALRGRRACRWSCSAARSTARARRATGRPRAPRCSACAR